MQWQHCTVCSSKHEQTAVDPGGVFAAEKGIALNVLDPLLELPAPVVAMKRKSRRSVQVDAAIGVYRDLKTRSNLHGFLHQPARENHLKTLHRDKSTAIENDRSSFSYRCCPIDMNTDPAVVSDIFGGCSRIAKRAYLGRLDDRVMALRFGYLHKGWDRACTGRELTASGDAADVLIDTSGGFEFNRTLEAALKTWKMGAEKALQATLP